MTLVTDDRALLRAATWLKRHGVPEQAPSHLLAARLRARRRLAAPVIGLAAALAVGIVFGSAQLRPDDYRRSVAPRIVTEFVVILAIVGLTWWWLRAVRRADLKIGAALPRRVTRPTRAGYPQVLGRHRLVIGAIGYGGSFALGLVALALARTGADRAVAGVLLAGLAVLTMLTTAELVEIVRRPAVAEDALTLAVDDALRVDEARGIVTSSIPALMTAFTVASLSTGTPSALVAVGYGLLALNVLLVMLDSVVAPARVAFGGEDG